MGVGRSRIRCKWQGAVAESLMTGVGTWVGEREGRERKEAFLPTWGPDSVKFKAVCDSGDAPLALGGDTVLSGECGPCPAVAKALWVSFYL